MKNAFLTKTQARAIAGSDHGFRHVEQGGELLLSTGAELTSYRVGSDTLFAIKGYASDGSDVDTLLAAIA